MRSDFYYPYYEMMAAIIRTDLEPYDRLLNKGFELAIKYEELNQFGLIEDYRDAVATQFALRDNY